MIRLKIKEDYKTAKKKPLKSSTIIEVNIVEKSPTIDKKKKSNGQKSEQAKEEIQEQLLQLW